MIVSLPYTNRTGKTYFLYQGVTRTGKPRYYFSGQKKTEAEQISTIPEGFLAVNKNLSIVARTYSN